MAPVLQPAVLLAVVSMVVLACAAPRTEPQWYKPGTYTVEEFQRDRTACTKDRLLDQACLRARGWIPLTADRIDTPPEPAPVRGRY
jgi:hypothetical protein